MEGNKVKKILSFIFLITATTLFVYTFFGLSSYNRESTELNQEIKKNEAEILKADENKKKSRSNLMKISEQNRKILEKDKKLTNVKERKQTSLPPEKVLEYKKDLYKPTGFLSSPRSYEIARIFPSAFFVQEQRGDPDNLAVLNLYIEDDFQRTLLENILRYNGEIHRFYGLLNYVRNGGNEASRAFILNTNLEGNLLELFEKGENPFGEDKKSLDKLEGFSNNIRREMLSLYPGYQGELQREVYTEEEEEPQKDMKFQRELASMSYMMSFYEDILTPCYSPEVSKELDFEDIHINIRGILNEEQRPFVIEIRQNDETALAYFSLEGDLYSVLNTETGEILFIRDEYDVTAPNRWAQMAEFAYRYCVS